MTTSYRDLVPSLCLCDRLLVGLARFALTRIVRPLSPRVPVLAPYGLLFALDAALTRLIAWRIGYFKRRT
jgi:hypothetical protein